MSIICPWIVRFYCLSERRLDRVGFQGQAWKSLVCFRLFATLLQQLLSNLQLWSLLCPEYNNMGMIVWFFFFATKSEKYKIWKYFCPYLGTKPSWILVRICQTVITVHSHRHDKNTEMLIQSTKQYSLIIQMGWIWVQFMVIISS